VTLRLTRAQRKALFAGEHPRITVHPDQTGFLGALSAEFKLSTKVGLRVVGTEEVEDGLLNLHYVVKDDRPRLLRARTRSAGFEEGLRNDLSPSEAIKAGEASAYTHSPGAALRGTGEEVSRADQERFKKESCDPALKALKDHRVEVRAALDRIRENPLLHGSGSFGSELRFAERKIEQVLSKIESRISGSARRDAA